MGSALIAEYDRILEALKPVTDRAAGPFSPESLPEIDLSQAFSSRVKIVLSDTVPVEFRQRKPAAEFPLSLDALETFLRPKGFPQIDYSFLPTLETQQVMHRSGQPLLTLGVRGQARYPVQDAHLWGINLMNYLQAPAFFTLLKLAGIPILREQRGSQFPLIILGGHIWPNPLPLSRFYDGMVVGDGEEVLWKIADLTAHLAENREALLAAIAALPGAYVPGYTHGPVKPVYIDFQDPAYSAGSSYILNDSGAVVLSRGCPYACAFCLSSHVGGRYRLKPFAQVVEHLQRLKGSGAKKVMLVASSASSYRSDGKTARDILQVGKELGLAMRTMSDRPEKVSPAYLVLSAREMGKAILAPEASPRIRAAVLRKTLGDDTLESAISTVISAGINRIQLYAILAVPAIPPKTMATLPEGFPGEETQDLRYLAELGMSMVDRMLAAGLPRPGDKPYVNLDCMPFIPAPGTRLQKLAFSSYDRYLERIAQLRGLIGPGYQGLLGVTPAMDRLMHLCQALLERGTAGAGLIVLQAWQESPSGILEVESLSSVMHAAGVELSDVYTDFLEKPLVYAGLIDEDP